MAYRLVRAAAGEKLLGASPASFPMAGVCLCVFVWSRMFLLVDPPHRGLLSTSYTTGKRTVYNRREGERERTTKPVWCFLHHLDRRWSRVGPPGHAIAALHLRYWVHITQWSAERDMRRCLCLGAARPAHPTCYHAVGRDRKGRSTVYRVNTGGTRA